MADATNEDLTTEGAARAGNADADAGRLHVLLVAGSPEPSSPDLVAGIASACDIVIAVDRGAEACRAAGVIPSAFCGDADTVSQDTLAWVREVSGEQAIYPCEKDDTDLSLAFDLAGRLSVAAGAKGWQPVVTCASGGRPDHALGVFGQLARHALLSPMLVEDGFECLVLSPDGQSSWQMGEEARGKEFSLVPLSDAVVSEQNMYWELDHEPLPALADRGISNRVTTGFARVECHEGVVAAFLRW